MKMNKLTVPPMEQYYVKHTDGDFINYCEEFYHPPAGVYVVRDALHNQIEAVEGISKPSEPLPSVEEVLHRLFTSNRAYSPLYEVLGALSNKPEVEDKVVDMPELYRKVLDRDVYISLNQEGEFPPLYPPDGLLIVSDGHYIKPLTYTSPLGLKELTPTSIYYFSHIQRLERYIGDMDIVSTVKATLKYFEEL